MDVIDDNRGYVAVGFYGGALVALGYGVYYYYKNKSSETKK